MRLLIAFAVATALVAVVASNTAPGVVDHTGGVWHPRPQYFVDWMNQNGEGYSLTGAENFTQMLGLFARRVTEFAKSYLGEVGASFDLGASEYPYFGFIPPLAATIVPDGPAVSWTNACFKTNSASAKTNSDGSYAVTMTVEEGQSLFCTDSYLLGTVEGVAVKTFLVHGAHSFTWTVAANATDAEKWYVKTIGIRVFRFEGNLIKNIGDLLSTAVLFGSELTKGVPTWVADANADFVRKYTPNGKFGFAKRNVTTVPIDESLIHSGDFFGVIRLDGLDPMLAWAMGSTTGHTTVALRIDGELYVAESTAKDSYWQHNGIQKTPYKQWVQMAQAAGYNVVWAPLSKEYRDKFNATAAHEVFQTLDGLNYGYRNMLFGWLDTLSDNYPCLPPTYDQCLQWEHIEVVFGLLDKLAPGADIIYDEAWNHRLGTTGLKAPEIFQTASARGMPLNSINQIVEQDSWNYTTYRYNSSDKVIGKAMVCCVFVCNMWKAGGIFDDIDSDFNCAELTNWDDYVLDIFDTTTPRPPQCVKADPNNKLCQIEGDYQLELNDFSTKAPYKHMAEHCPSRGPDYKKPANC